MENPEETKIPEIKISYDFGVSSRHILDLTGDRIAVPKNCDAKKARKFFSILGDILPFSLIKGLFWFFLFLFKKIRESLVIVFRETRPSGINSAPAPVKKIFRGFFIFLKLKKAAAFADDRQLSFDFSPPEHWSRALGAFAAVALLVILPIKALGSYEDLERQKNEIIKKSFAGYEAMKKRDYSAAGESFATAKVAIDELGFVIKNVISAIPGLGTKLSAGDGLLTVGEKLAEAAGSLDEAVKKFDSGEPLTEKIKFLKSKIQEAAPDLLIASAALDAVGKNYSALPVDITPFRNILKEGTKALLVFEDFSGALLDLLGDERFKRYLFIFQNNNEIRPTGGFIGSFAVIDIDRGRIKGMEIPGGGSYDVKGQLKELVISPEPLHLINSAWQFQDSNWFPDFPEAAKKIMWFYEKAGGPTVDGVVAVNASFMEDILDVIGPVDMPEYGRLITADNFMDETQKIVELEYDKEENKPKQFIADMAPKVLERLTDVNAKELETFARVIRKAVLEKDIQVYVRNGETEEKLASFGLAGELRDISGFTDYLMLVDTNIAGQKTDGKIVKEINHYSEIRATGDIIDTVKITRRHTGVKGTLFSGVRNVDYLRLYVPDGSELLDASGFTAPPAYLFKPVRDGYSPDIDLERITGAVFVDPKSGTRVNKEFGRTVFGNWIMVDPGQEVTVTFRYKLPKKTLFPKAPDGYNPMNFEKNFYGYRMFIEKQSGAKNTYFKSRVKVEVGAPAALVGEGAAMEKGGWQYEAKLDSDKYYGAVVEE
jgi:hypothetical protein